MSFSENDFWFNNVKKQDAGTTINIIPSEKGEKIEIKSSSTYTDASIRNVTDENPSTKWVSDYNTISKYDGKYIGDKQTVLTNGSIINGEWIQVIIPSRLVVKEYQLLPGKIENTNKLTPFPRDFYLLGSNDENKWDIIDSHFNYNPVYFDINTPITIIIDNTKRYDYVRLVISSLNITYIDYQYLGSVSLSIFNLKGNICYSLNKICETFQPYSNKENMSKIEGLTMMEENMNVLEDLKIFNEKYHKYIKCSDITLSEETKQHCTSEDSNIEIVNDAYDKLMDNESGSISRLQKAPLNVFSTITEYENNHKEIIEKHKQIIPLRKELDSKLKQLMDEKNSINADYKKKYDRTMYSSLVLSVILTSSLFFIFKKL